MVAGMDARTGDDQVTDPRKAGKRLGRGSHRDPQPRNLSDPAGHQGRFGVIPQLKTVHNPGGQSNHVFECAAQLHSGHIITDINPEPSVHQHVLHTFGSGAAPARRNHCSRHPARDLLRMGRA